MYGPLIMVSHKGVTIKLRALEEKDIVHQKAGLARLSVTQFTELIFDQGLAALMARFATKAQSKGDVNWAIVPKANFKKDIPIGVTTLNGTDTPLKTVSGIIIWEPKYWGKGYATAAHLGRMSFADHINLPLVRSSAREENTASRLALARVGYSECGEEPCSIYRGKYMTTILYTWLNPRWIKMLYPKGLPEKYVGGVERATIALELARREVTFP